MSFYKQLQSMTKKDTKKKISTTRPVIEKEAKITTGKIDFNISKPIREVFSSARANDKFNIDIEELKTYLNIYDEDESNEILLESLIGASVEYIKDYTGLSDEEIQSKSDSFKVCVFLIVSDLYDNRGQQNLQFKKNLMLTSILDMHCKNYL